MLKDLWGEVLKFGNFSILIQVVDVCLLRITMRMSVTPQDSEPIRLSNEDERVDQSSVSNNGKVSLRFLWRCAENQDSVISRRKE